MMSLERSGAFCINKWSAAGRLGIKSFQLSLAKTCGPRIPATLLQSTGIAQSPVAGLDVRIVMLNREFHAFRMTSEASRAGIERIQVPTRIESKLRRFAEHADIAFGCFDMVVDADGDWWFLNADPNGEVLGTDNLRPDHVLFEPMLALLSSREWRNNQSEASKP